MFVKVLSLDVVVDLRIWNPRIECRRNPFHMEDVKVRYLLDQNPCMISSVVDLPLSAKA